MDFFSSVLARYCCHYTTNTAGTLLATFIEKRKSMEMGSTTFCTFQPLSL